MLYMGSKAKLAKHIIPLLQPYLSEAPCYIEPFVGGCNLIDKVRHRDKRGYDIDAEVIAMFNMLKQGWIPPETFSREHYYDVKWSETREWPLHVRGYVLGCSFGGKKGHGFMSSNKEGARDYTREYYNNIMRQVKNLEDVKLECKDYKEIEVPHGSVVYCDPPYRATSKYIKQSIDYEVFDEWCKETAKRAHVFVSEQLGAIAGQLLWQQERSCTLRDSWRKSALRTEALYKI